MNFTFTRTKCNLHIYTCLNDSFSFLYWFLIPVYLIFSLHIKIYSIVFIFWFFIVVILYLWCVVHLIVSQNHLWGCFLNTFAIHGASTFFQPGFLSLHLAAWFAVGKQPWLYTLDYSEVCGSHL